MSELQKRLYLYFVAVITLLPIPFVVSWPTTDSAQQWILWGSALAGYAGVVFMLWMYAIGTRAVSGLFFTDYARLMKTHAWLGKYGTVLIFLHPILTTLSAGESWLYSFVPRLDTEFEKHVTYGRIALAALLVVWISSALLRSRLSYRVWNYLHYIAYAAVPFALLHIPDTGSSYAAHVATKLYFVCIVVGFLIFALLKARDVLLINKVRYRVARSAEVSPGVWMVTVTPLGDDGLRPQPGQYVYIKQSFWSEEHPFSVTQYDEASGAMTITYKVVGAYTKVLAELAVGDEVLMSGPYGVFTEQLSLMPSQAAVFIAGGIGITPFIDRIMNENERREQWLFYATRDARSATFAPELKRQLGERMVQIYSNDSASPSAEHGMVTAELVAKYLTATATAYQYFICGPAPMMAAVTDQLKRLGVGEGSIHTEEFTF